MTDTKTDNTIIVKQKPNTNNVKDVKVVNKRPETYNRVNKEHSRGSQKKQSVEPVKNKARKEHLRN